MTFGMKKIRNAFLSTCRFFATARVPLACFALNPAGATFHRPNQSLRGAQITNGYGVVGFKSTPPAIGERRSNLRVAQEETNALFFMRWKRLGARIRRQP